MSSKPISKRLQKESFYEKQWLKNSEHFNPTNTAIKRSDLKKIQDLVGPLAGKKCVDLGSGYGELSKMLAQAGADVTAVDIAPSALKKVEGNARITPEQHLIPYTALADEAFDYVFAVNLIAELPENEYRLFISELARIIKPDGTVLIATPLDIHSQDALQKLIYLAETEFDLSALRLSYHRIMLQISTFLKKFLPSFSTWLENQDAIVRIFEKMTRFIYDQEGASYAILLGTRRPLLHTPPESELPIEPKGKKAVWE